MTQSRSYWKVLLALALTAGACEGDGASVTNNSTGGNKATGGTSATGGVSTSTGGVTATGGVSATGGIRTGGVSQTGGLTATGGVSTTGGVTATGGRSNTGGVSNTGGSSPATGGSSPSTGGSSTDTGGAGPGTGGRSPDAGVTSTGGLRDAGMGATGGTVSATGGGVIISTKKFVGNITTNGRVRDDFSKYWNQITPENEGKWGSVQPSNANSFNWSSLDAIYKYANDNNIIFKQHTFVWGAQQPNWVNNSNGATAVPAWIKAFCQRYPKTALIDVVNEPPPHTTPAYADSIGGGTNGTWTWVANSFKWSRESCPNAILILNDYNTIEIANQRDNIINIANKVKAAGAPIDAVGVQAHGLANASAATAKGHIDTIASKTGLPVYVTEFDIGIADDNQQKNKIQEHFTMFYTNENVKGITIWGYIMGATWVANTGLMQSSGTFRPSMTWLMSYLGK